MDKETPKKPMIINATALAEEVRANNRENYTNPDWTSKQVCFLLENAPRIDAELVIRCHACGHSFESKRSKTGLACDAWGVDDFACDCDPNGYCYKSKPKNLK